MKPYRNLKSKNLGLVLFFARITAVVGLVFTILAFGTVFMLLIVPVGILFKPAFAFVAMSFGLVFMSGLMAAIVAFEERDRIRTEHLLKINKI